MRITFALPILAGALGLGACTTAPQSTASSTSPPPAAPTAQPGAPAGAGPTTGRIALTTFTCNDLLHVPPDARASVAMFFLGHYVGRTNLQSIDPANVEPALKVVGEYCEKNPTSSAVRAFQLALAPYRAGR
jgi:hypothetical protein